ncbi:MAG: hypothetical protein K9M44_01990 [Candidatus Pacebacteria bacterium]|nr:hypothetical protein [Candidatus Paceibacterota bacterium]
MKFSLENNFKKQHKNLDNYNDSLLEFIKKEGLSAENYDNDTERIMDEKFKLLFDKRNDYEEGFVKLENPNYFKNFFKEKKYNIIKPQSIIKKNSTTLFTSAGVQILDDYIFDEKEITKDKMYVAQPVIRTQFIDSIKDGVSTSFINISTEKMNPTTEDHFSSIKDWLNILDSLGINRNNLDIFIKKGEPNWGGKVFKNNIFMFFYKGLEIGDAIYAYDIPQSTRESTSFSDIGFGLERLRWSLSHKNYFDYNEDNGASLKTLDYCKTLALLSGSGVRPSNKSHGYRFRQFSKRLQQEFPGRIDSTKKIINHYYNFWTKWTSLDNGQEDSLQLIEKENERNFNRLLLDVLSESYSDVGIDINMSTVQLLESLKGTSVKEEHLNKILTEIYEKH